GGAFKVTEGLLDRFGADRVIDTPISETGFVGAAAGAAHMGLRPVCEMQFIDFVSCAYSILTNYVATARYRASLPCPMVVRGAGGGRALSIIADAATVWKALEAAEQLQREEGLSVEVLDLRSLLPMDDEAIVATVKKTNRVLIVHEDTVTGGIAGEITARLN